MLATEHTIIPLSKVKLLALAAASLLFVVLGVWLFVEAEAVGETTRKSAGFIQVVSVLAVVFFGLVGGFLAWKLRDSKPGLIVGPEGIIDNSSGVAAGLIPWEDVEGFSTASIERQHFLMVHVRNPQAYIEAQRNVIVRKMMAANWKRYDSPITLSANGLKCTFAELEQLLTEAHTRYGNP